MNCPLARALKGEQVDNVEILLRNPELPDGINTRVSGRPIYDENGALIGAVAAIHDISGIKAAEAQLRVMNDELIVQSQLLQSIFNSINDGVVVIDETGYVIMFNSSVQQLAGEGMLLQNIEQWLEKYTCFYPDRVTPFSIEEHPIRRAIQGESIDDVEMFVQNLRGLDNGLYVSVTGRPLRDTDGDQKGFVIVVRDVTEKINSEEALEQAFTRGRLEIVDTILHNIGNAINSVSVGIDTIHHQLVNDRLTPRLTALANAIEKHQDDFSDYVKNDPQGQKVLPFILTLAADFNLVKQRWEQTVDRIRNRTRHIVDIIRTQGAYQGASTTRKDINLEVAISDAVKILRDSIDKRQIEIGINCDQVHQGVRIQESQFHQMLVNLIKNSIEAIDELAESGGLHEPPYIHITAQTKDGFLSIYITDNGIGLMPEETKKIFAAGFTTKEHGSGLGLHASANFVISSGGKIYPLSQGKGEGTTMHIMFPILAIQPDNHQELT